MPRMFEPSDKPRLFAMPPGADFPRVLADGLWARMADLPPEAVARVEIFVNTARMQRRLRSVLAEGRAALLPRIRLITDLGRDIAAADLPPAVPSLRRRLELTQLVARLLEAQPDLAPRSAIYDLADSLAGLMDEMQGEGVPPKRIAALDLSNHSGHWERSLGFIRIVGQFFGPDHPPDTEARQRLVVERLEALWAANPPAHPIIVAGSTGSRGTTSRFMQAVARLPQGALVLPGFDFDMPPGVWQTMGDAMASEDHPQYRFRKLLDAVGMSPLAVKRWLDAPAPSPARNRLVSLSLRPAPVTDQWMTEGRLLADLAVATADMTLIEAQAPREEAMAIALVLRKAAEDGVTAALVTPDRGLTRQVTAALDRWGILPDDSAGRPLHLSAPGRLLRHVAALFGRKLTAQALLTLLKHPLTGSGGDRGNHLRLTRDLELKLRKAGPQFPTGADLQAWAATRPGAGRWGDWLSGLLAGTEVVHTRPLADHLAHHLAVVEALATGPDGVPAGELWLKPAGIEARAAAEELLREAQHGGAMTPSDYADLFSAILSRRDVREPLQTYPGIMIWGTLEARVQGADLVILGGLNDGVWPAAPSPDPWLNRKMRYDAGLLLPERQIGLAAHDYQQAIAAPRVVLSRALRSTDAETVPSRWLNRLTNLLAGLEAQGGNVALAAMRGRGQAWLQMAVAMDLPAARSEPAKRPAPCPPVSARPRALFVTEITRLIRDPYAIYARHVLRLKPLDPLHQDPDAAERGSAVHRILEQFIAGRGAETNDQALARLMTVVDEVLGQEVPWPAARRMWRARIARVADWFLLQEATRPGKPATVEKTGSVMLSSPDFKLSARPDRIDELPDGSLHILDYKTGSPPTKVQQDYFEKQLLLEAAMAERGAFASLGPRPVAAITYVGLGATPKEEHTDLTPELTAKIWEELITLLTAYLDPTKGYASRRAMHTVRFAGDYDHLARYGEWEMSDAPMPEPVGSQPTTVGQGK